MTVHFFALKINKKVVGRPLDFWYIGSMFRHWSTKKFKCCYYLIQIIPKSFKKKKKLWNTLFFKNTMAGDWSFFFFKEQQNCLYDIF